jgi:hypothetical protein
MRVPLATVRKLPAELSAAGQVVTYQLTRYEGSKTIEAWQCRVSGYVPAPARAGHRGAPAWSAHEVA